MTMTYDSPWLATAEGYAQAQGITVRTVKRWLAAGELPGATKDELGRWMIPNDAQRTTGELVTMENAMTRPMTSQPVTLDALPSFLTVDEAAQILGISRHAIATHREYFDVVPFGPHGSLVVPLATIKRIRG